MCHITQRGERMNSCVGGGCPVDIGSRCGVDGVLKFGATHVSEINSPAKIEYDNYTQRPPPQPVTAGS